MSDRARRVEDDQPLLTSTALENDKLDRRSYANAAVGALQSISNTAGYVISVEGSWGSGKTSTLAMIEQLLGLDKKHVVVHFNPWIIGDQHALMREFFKAVANALEMSDYASDAKNASKDLLNYSKVLDAVKWIPGAEPWASIFKGVMTSVGSATAAIAAQKELSLEATKARLTSSLVALKTPIVVIVDDVDRLFPAEVFEVVRIIKAVGSFPNIGYLVAWDAQYVSAALHSASVPRAETYLDKIVQVRLPLPALSEGAKIRLLNEAINALDPLVRLGGFHSAEERMQELYFNGLRDLIEQPRDVVRLFNTLRVIEPNLRHEIVFADILGLAALIVHAAPVFDELKRTPKMFTQGRLGDGIADKGAAGKAEFRKAMRKLYRKCARPEAVARLVAHLFPQVARASDAFSITRVQAVAGHLAEPGRLAVALKMTIGEGDVSLWEVRRYVVDEATGAGIETALSSESAIEFVTMVGEIASSIEGCGYSAARRLASLVDWMARQGKAPQRQMMVYALEDAAISAMDRAMEAYSSSVREKLVLEVVADPDCLSVAAELLLRSRDSRAEEYVLFIPETELDRSVRMYVRNARRAAGEGLLWGCANPSRVLWEAARNGKKSQCRALLEAIKGNDPELDVFVERFFRHSFSSDGGQAYAVPDEEHVEKFVSVKSLKARAKKRLSDKALTYPLRAVWRAIHEGGALYGRDGSSAVR